MSFFLGKIKAHWESKTSPIWEGVRHKEKMEDKYGGHTTYSCMKMEQ
jgi:hypothetical protein